MHLSVNESGSISVEQILKQWLWGNTEHPRRRGVLLREERVAGQRTPSPCVPETALEEEAKTRSALVFL